MNKDLHSETRPLQYLALNDHDGDNWFDEYDVSLSFWRSMLARCAFVFESAEQVTRARGAGLTAKDCKDRCKSHAKDGPHVMLSEEAETPKEASKKNIFVMMSSSYNICLSWKQFGWSFASATEGIDSSAQGHKRAHIAMLSHCWGAFCHMALCPM